MDKRTVILLLICLFLAVTTLTVRHIESEKENIKSRFVPPPQAERRRPRSTTSTAGVIRKVPGAVQGRIAPAKETTPSSSTRPIPFPERVLDTREEGLPEERAPVPHREETVPYGDDLVTPLETSPAVEAGPEPEPVEPPVPEGENPADGVAGEAVPPGGAADLAQDAVEGGEAAVEEEEEGDEAVPLEGGEEDLIEGELSPDEETVDEGEAVIETGEEGEDEVVYDEEGEVLLEEDEGEEEEVAAGEE